MERSTLRNAIRDRMVHEIDTSIVDEVMKKFPAKWVRETKLEELPFITKGGSFYLNLKEAVENGCLGDKYISCTWLHMKLSGAFCTGLAFGAIALWVSCLIQHGT